MAATGPFNNLREWFRQVTAVVFVLNLCSRNMLESWLGMFRVHRRHQPHSERRVQRIQVPHQYGRKPPWVSCSATPRL